MSEHPVGASVVPMTAAHIAVAIVAACGVTGTRPDAVFSEGQGRARVMAAAACIARLGWDRKATARAFQVHTNRLTPSGLLLAKVQPDDLLTVAEALRASGLTDAEPAGVARPQSPAAKAAAPEHKPEGTAAGTRAARPDPQAVAATASGGDVKRPSSPGRNPALAPSRAANAVRPVASAAAPRAAMRLKPLNARIVVWTRQQLALGADLEFVADCFGVDHEALAAAVRPMGMAA